MSEPVSPSPGGLSESDAAERLRRHGPNELPQARKRTVWRMAGEVLREPMLQLLVGAGLIYLVLGDTGEALALLAFVVFSISISLVQETRTERVLEALRDLSSPRALVIRGGQRRRIAGREVVPGDLVVLSEGDRVPADACLIEGHELHTDESLLTGESVPVRKLARVPDAAMLSMRPGGDDLPMVFSGSLVVRGHGLAEVTATGERSQMGQIGQALRQIETQPTALNQQTRALVRLFAVIGVSLSVLVGGLYLWLRGDALGALLAGITLAMAMLPEEFPLILTVFMAMGAWRISQRRVLVRRASAIEALGAATVLCTDKTGTLTLNRMTVAALHTADGQRWEAGEARLPEAFHALLEHGILASQREPFDPMEKAFWDLAATHLTDADREHLHPDWTLAHEYALTPDLLAMSHVWRRADRTAHVIAAKGAPEAVADLCHLPPAQLAAVRQQVEQMAARGLRVLGVARAECEAPPTDGTWPVLQHDFDFVFLGLVALVDPLRPEVRQAVQTCRAAGIRVAMITGDYPVTALAIAGQAGIDTAGGVLRGEDIAALDDAALSERVRTTTVFARVMPEQKWRIVRACQANGDIVAMTGDGVNDAPSLKAADIGIAMGGRGTDVAREASDMVLLDDDFAAIAQATRLGRRIDDNLRKGMAFVLAVHVPIAGLSLLPLLTGWPLLFLPLHIALLELIIDPVCSVVFEAEPEEANLMQRPPRPADTPLLGPATMVWSALQGGVVMAVVGGLYVWALRTGQPEAEARTTAFLALVLGNGALILNSRPLSGGWWAGLRQHNPMLGRMALATVAVLALVLGWPAVREVFQMARPTGPMLAVVLAAGVGCWLALLGVRGLQLRWLR